MKTGLFKFTILALYMSFAPLVFSQNLSFSINTNEVLGENTEFWKAAGSDHLFYHVLKTSGQALLDRMEQTKSHVYFRSHHTFCSDTIHGVPRGQNVYSEDNYGNPVYDFSNLNKVFHEYVKRGMKPIVEYDYLPRELEYMNDAAAGNDEGMRMKNIGPNDWSKWSALMKATTQNLIDVFGDEEVRTWYFEVWNEPDGWPQEQIDVFFKMYDVFVDAVTSVDPKLRVGGPASYHEWFLKPFVEHVTSGKNNVTGEIGTRIDFISYHIYGLSGGWLDKEPYIHPQVQRFSQSVLWLQRLIEKYPTLKDVEFHINEWGLCSNYYRTVEEYPALKYRNNIESALFLVKLVNSLFQIEDNYNFPTSLLLFWGFSGEADENELFTGKRELLTGGNTPKPIQTGFEMLAQLEKQRIEVKRHTNDEGLGLLATKSANDKVAFIAYNYGESTMGKHSSNKGLIEIIGLKPNTKYKLNEFILDNNNNNTYAAWEKMGEPSFSTGLDFRLLQKAGTLSQTSSYTLSSNKDGELEIQIALPEFSLCMIHLDEVSK
jgi:xylan 1,4-beta-xylosidase